MFNLVNPSVLSTRKLASLRASLRGYSVIKRKRQLAVLRNIKSKLVDCTLDEIVQHASGFIFGKSISQSECVVRQFLLDRNGGNTLIRKILESIGNPRYAIVYPMPKEWRDMLKSEGINVDEIKSRFAWVILVFLYFAHGVLSVLHLAAVAVMLTLRRASQDTRRYAYFDLLSTANLPAMGSGRSYDICTWYIRWQGHLEGIESVRHSVIGANAVTVDDCSVEYTTKPFHKIRGFQNVLHFIAWGVSAIVVAAADGLRGRWWHAIALTEAARAKAVHLSDSGYLARDYLFHYSGNVYRPMWTYEAEAKGSRIICYFYSTSEVVKLPSGYESQHYDWGASSWPLYLVWDSYQEKIIRRDIDKEAAIEVVGPIWFSDSEIEVPPFKGITIGVFDIQPHRSVYYIPMGHHCDFELEHPEFRIRFLEDIYSVIMECGANMAIKKKREIGRRVKKKYQKKLEELAISQNVVMVPPSISPIRVIEKCQAIISMPFTSTAQYRSEPGNLNVYYDPTGWLQKEDPGAHGVPILSGIEELRHWVQVVVAKFPEKS